MNEIAVEPIIKVPEPLKKTKTGLISSSVPVPHTVEPPPLLKQPMTGV